MQLSLNTTLHSLCCAYTPTGNAVGQGLGLLCAHYVVHDNILSYMYVHCCQHNSNWCALKTLVDLGTMSHCQLGQSCTVTIEPLRTDITVDLIATTLLNLHMCSRLPRIQCQSSWKAQTPLKLTQFVVINKFTLVSVCRT